MNMLHCTVYSARLYNFFYFWTKFRSNFAGLDECKHLLTKQVCWNLGHSLPEPLMRDFLSQWIAFWSLARGGILEVSSQHFPNSSLCCRNPRAKRFLSSNLAIFEASVTFHVQTGLCLGHMICHPLNSWCQEPSSPDFWHQPSWNTLHYAAFSQISFFFLPSSSHSLFCSVFHLLSPAVFLLSDLAYSWSWFRHGRV